MEIMQEHGMKAVNNIRGTKPTLSGLDGGP